MDDFDKYMEQQEKEFFQAVEKDFEEKGPAYQDYLEAMDYILGEGVYDDEIYCD